jgi:hypothetical protein
VILGRCVPWLAWVVGVWSPPAAEVAVDVTHETMPTWDDAAADHAVTTVVAVLSSVCGVRVELQARRRRRRGVVSSRHTGTMYGPATVGLPPPAT